MKRVNLISSIIYENAFSYFLILILLAILAYLMQGTASMIRSYNEVLWLAEESGLDHKILASYSAEDVFFNDTDFEQDLADISKIAGVESFLPVRFMTFFAADNEKGVDFTLDTIIEDVYGDMRYPLVEGTWPEAPGEIALAENMSKVYNIGDRISVDIFQYAGTANYRSPEIFKETLTITGFLNMDAQMLDFWIVGDQYDISDMSRTLRTQYMNQNSTGALGVVVPQIDSEGRYLGVDPRGNSILITPDQYTTPEQLKISLTTIFPDEQIQIGQELIDRYHVSYRSEYESMMRNLIIVSALALSTLFSSVFLQVRKKKLEMAVYYMCGSTWRQSVSLFCMVYVPIILLSVLSGSAAFMLFNTNRRWFDGADTWLITLSLLVVSFLFILPLYMIVRRSSPIEQTRKD